MERPDFFTLRNGEKVKLPFSPKEYQDRVDKLRKAMSENDIEITILTSMHNIAYYSGFIYCSFGSQPWSRSHCDNIIYTDWKKDNFFKAINSIIDKKDKPKSIGIENDHITLETKDKLNSTFENATFKDISKKLMKHRMIKSDEEIEIIKNGARIADLGAEEIVKLIKPGQTELEIAIAGRDRMEREIAKSYPGAEYMDTWVWFQSGINTDGAHNPKTNRAL